MFHYSSFCGQGCVTWQVYVAFYVTLPEHFPGWSPCSTLAPAVLGGSDGPMSLLTFDIVSLSFLAILVGV